MRHHFEPPVYEKVDKTLHPEHETRNTRVSEYLRKYGQGKIDSLPTDSRPTINDQRTTDEMLSDGDNITNNMATEPLDVMCEIAQNSERFKAAFAEVELTKKQKEQFDAAIAVLDNPNSSFDQQHDAYCILEELEQAKKVTRARK